MDISTYLSIFRDAAALRGKYLEADEGEKADQQVDRIFEAKKQLEDQMNDLNPQLAKLMDDENAYIRVGAASHLIDISEFHDEAYKVLQTERARTDNGFAAVEALAGIAGWENKSS